MLAWLGGIGDSNIKFLQNTHPFCKLQKVQQVVKLNFLFSFTLELKLMKFYYLQISNFVVLQVQLPGLNIHTTPI